MQIELEKYRKVHEEDKKHLIESRNQIQALNNKVAYKECIAEDAERDKARSAKEIIELEKKITELKNLHEVIQMMEKSQENKESSIGLPGASSVSSSVKWATQVRQQQPVEQQATIFYESYRIVLVKEDAYKTRIESLRKENKKLIDQKEFLEADYAYLKKKCQGLLEKNKKYKQ